jgi:hypothetical protein
MNLCFFSVDIWIDTFITLTHHNLSVERYINHFKVSNQHYLKINVYQYFKSIDSIYTLKSTLFCFLYFRLIFISVLAVHIVIFFKLISPVELKYHSGS